ncbi:MAG: DUF58 domain-containing protein [Opitutales bacterium]|nr:DUF58 domain-containing protein [Opitutales bacterium]
MGFLRSTAPAPPGTGAPPAGDWSDPGFLLRNSPIRNAWRLFIQLFKPPRGHRTVPTRTGMVLILLALGIGTAAFNTAQNILYIALAMLLSSLLLSGLLSWMNFKGCRWRLQTVEPYRVGEPGTVELAVFNGNRWLPIYSLSFDLAAVGQKLAQRLSLNRGLSPGDTSRLAWDFTPTRRGTETVLLQRLSSKFPFGFLVKTIDYTQPREIVVWPARVPYTLQLERARYTRPLGNIARRPGGGTELRNLRHYRPGDSLRRIHWKASARQRRLIVRENLEDAEQSYVLVIAGHARNWPRPAQFERLCAFAATLAEDLHVAGRLAGVGFGDEGVQRVHTLGDMHAVLDRMALLQPSDLRPASIPPGALVILEFAPSGSDHVTCVSNGNPVGQA